MAALLPIRAQEIALPPTYWNVLTPEDKAEFMRLRASFLQGQKISSKDRRIVTFRKELTSVLKFIERSEIHQEERSILVGVCFAGRVICVNTRQLKGFLGRCKSSINGSFQQMGYVALRTKAKARNCVVAVMPSLQNEQNILRQWTVRCASNDAQYCFISSFTNIPIPTITEDDLYDEKRPQQSHSMASQVNFQMQAQNPYPQFQMPPQLPPRMPGPYLPMHNAVTAAVPVKPRKIEFDLPSLEEMEPYNQNPTLRSDLVSSMSLDAFPTTGGDNWDDGLDFEPTSFEWDQDAPAIPGAPKPMIHSSSAFLPPIREYDIFDY